MRTNKKKNNWIWSALFIWSWTQSAGAAVVVQEEKPPDSVEPPPAIVLNHTQGNFFVLASEFPFAVGKASSKVEWFDVERLEGLETLPRIVELTPHPGELRSGIHFSAVRIDVTTPAGDDHLLIPVILRVGEQYEDQFGIDEDVLEQIPQSLLRIESKDPAVTVTVKSTPGGHFIIEILNELFNRSPDPS